MRAVLVVLGVLNAASGALALIAPGTFFDEIGRYGVENLHYVGDVGAFTAAAGAGLIVAAYRPAWRVPVLALATIEFALHAINHAFDTDEARSDARGIADTVLLALGAVGSAYLARAAERLQAQ